MYSNDRLVVVTIHIDEVGVIHIGYEIGSLRQGSTLKVSIFANLSQRWRFHLDGRISNRFTRIASQ